MPDSSAHRRTVLLVTTLAGFLTPFLDSAITVALPALSLEFRMDAVTLTWIRTAYLLSAAVFLVPFGKLADIHGRKRVFLAGMVIFTLAALLGGSAGSIPALLAARVVQGLGGAMVFGTNVAILTSVFPPAQRGRVLGINVASVYLGLSLGPTLGGLLTGSLGWRSVFFSSAALALLGLLMALLYMRGEWAEARGQRFDGVGAAIYSAGLVALMVGVSLLPAIQGMVLIGAGLLGLALFARWEMGFREPVLNIRLLAGNRPYALSNLAALIHYGATSAVGFLLSLYLQQVRGLTAEQAGWVLVVQPLMQALFSPLAGRLSDRVEPRVVASSGMGLTVAGLLFLITTGAGTPLWAIRLCLVGMGLGFALFSSPNMNAIMGSVERSMYGVASGMLGTMRLVGQMLSMGITTLLFALTIGRVAITPEVHPALLAAMRTAFAIYAALCVGGIFASLARGAIRENHDTHLHSAAVPPAPDR